jgi:hypothetical protein
MIFPRSSTAAERRADKWKQLYTSAQTYQEWRRQQTKRLRMTRRVALTIWLLAFPVATTKLASWLLGIPFGTTYLLTMTMLSMCLAASWMRRRQQRSKPRWLEDPLTSK